MELYDTIKLHDNELEEGILGAVMIENSIFQKLSAEWDETIFYKQSHRTIAWAIKDLFIQNKPMDLLTLPAHLKANNKLEEVGGTYTISQLSNRVASTANTEYHYRILQQYAMLRRLATLGEELKISVMQPDADPLEIGPVFEQKIASLTGNLIRFNINPVSKLNKEALQRLEQIRSGEIEAGIYMGFTGLQKKLGGWHKGELVILAARPAMGKTSLAIKFLLQPAIIKNIPTALFSLEMGNNPVLSRIQSDLSGKSATDLIRGEVTHDDINRVYMATQCLNTAPIYIDDTPALTVFDFRQRANKLKKDHNIQLIIIDYLQLMRSGLKGGNREQDISYISRSLKQISKDLDLPILALSQLSRDVEKRASKRPMLSDLRESGAIEQDADVVMFIHRPEYYGEDRFEDQSDATGKAELIIAKNRNGGTGLTILGFKAENVMFYDLEPETNKIEPNTNF